LCVEAAEVCLPGTRGASAGVREGRRDSTSGSQAQAASRILAHEAAGRRSGHAGPQGVLSAAKREVAREATVLERQ
jgi:hypothetical protein